MDIESGLIVSEGTLRSEDLIPVLLNVCQALEVEGVDAMRDEFVRLLDDDGEVSPYCDESASELTNELMDKINDACPANLYFGAHEGDGACFGFWEIEVDNDDGDTQSVIAAMMVENTGVHFLDSGGANGRHWQANRGRTVDDFKASGYSHIEGEVFQERISCCITVNLFHWLTEKLDYDLEMDQRYRKFATRKEAGLSRWDMPADLTLMEEFAQSHHEGIDHWHTFNSYNGECVSFLSQVIQGTTFTHDGTPYVLLQIHGGADVRGGYTEPRVFTMRDEWSIFDASLSIYFGHDEGSWYSDDGGHHWYWDGCSTHELTRFPVSTDPADKGQGERIYFDEEARMAYCPFTGNELTLN